MSFSVSELLDVAATRQRVARKFLQSANPGPLRRPANKPTFSCLTRLTATSQEPSLLNRKAWEEAGRISQRKLGAVLDNVKSRKTSHNEAATRVVAIREEMYNLINEIKEPVLGMRY